VGWHTLRLLRLLRRRCQARTTLSCTTSHYSTEEVAGPVANLGRLGLGRAVVLRILAGTTAGLDFALKLRNPVLVSRLWLVCVAAHVVV
jgi:hypothetical protein